MHVVTVTFTLHPGQLGSFMPLMRAQRAASLAHSRGCRTFEIAHDGVGQVFLYELYDHPDDFANHLKTPHFRAFAGASADMVAAKQVMEWQLDAKPDGSKISG